MTSHTITPVAGLVSVIMPCYNAEAFLRAAVDSALGQTYPNIELIVVDDGSTDGSKAILREYGRRITLLEQERKGPYPARNRGLAACRGEFVAFLDADDYWDAAFVASMLASLERHPAAAVAYCGWQNVGTTQRNTDPFVPPDYEADDKLAAFLRAASPWPIHAALVRRSALDAAGGFDESLASCLDYDLWLRIGAVQPIVRVPQVLAFYRFHDGGQITSKEWLQARNVWLVKQQFVRKHPELTRHLPQQRLRELIDGGLAHRAYRAYWRRDLVSAQRIFRMVWRTGHWTMKDLRYILPALLPEGAYKRLVALADRGGG